MGRPKLSVTRTVLIGVRFTPEESQLIESAIARSTRVKSEWIRDTVLAAARLTPGGQGVERGIEAPLSRVEQPGDDFLD